MAAVRCDGGTVLRGICRAFGDLGQKHSEINVHPTTVVPAPPSTTSPALGLDYQVPLLAQLMINALT